MPAKRKGAPSRSSLSGSRARRNEASTGERTSSPFSINLWGIAGRQEIMEMRRLLQLKIPRR